MIYVDTGNEASKKSTVLLVIILGVVLFFAVRMVIDVTRPVTPISGSDNPIIQTPINTNNGNNTVTPVGNQTPDSTNPIQGTTLCEISAGDSGQIIEGAGESRKWVLIGTEFNESEKTLTVQIKLNQTAESLIQQGQKPDITYEIGGTKKAGSVALKTGSTLEYIQGVYVGDLDPNSYNLKVAASFKSGPVQTANCQFNVSYPVYVTWSFDWEGYDVNQQYLSDMENLANKYEIPMTHFFNPRIYITSASVISQDRANYLTNWVLNRAKNNGDSIDMHMHMFLDMVKAAGVNPKTSPNWGGNYPDGYNILTSAYSYEEMKTLLSWAKGIFKQHGLPEAKIYRTGGWYANQTTLMALQDSGFVADSSGRTKYKLWNESPDGYWDLAPTSQPYHPNDFNQNSSDTPNMKLWEFPDNGADSYAFTTEQLIDRFKQNYNGGQAKARTTVTFLSHPHWYNIDKPKNEKLFEYVDNYNSKKDRGPVVYINMDNLYKVYSGLK